MTEPRSDRSCVLVVDDEEGVRESLCEAVEMAGCNAISARNGAEALELLAGLDPCLVIVDLSMPVMSGPELLAAMKLDARLAKLPVLISTSAPGRAPPGVPVLAKPVDLDALLGWIAKSCDCAAPAQ